MEDVVTKREYDEHRNKCGKSFDDVFAKLDKMERAMFGEAVLKQKGVLDMTTEMYHAITTARGSEKVFWFIVKIASAVITLSATYYLLIEFFKKIK